MSRAHVPPKSLSDDDKLTMGEVRRDIWVDGFFGMAVGSVSGLTMHTLARFVGRYRSLPFALNANTALASFLGGGAFGSLLLSTTKGKNLVHRLHPIFEKGKKEDKEEKSYQDALEFSKGREQGVAARRTARDVPVDPEEERVDLLRNRLFRRTTLKNALERSRGGLNDSHGGHWVSDEKPEKEA
mmetsp:Transcript_15278/g.42330  ORF Transcript_15278/g.42330 Transcript_15278/m.42330 type:complete len:185 (+) Transcript_15278:95-649(+)|eukprot:CAMPEP_0168739924 /NCGR_PEP_ID=MMETSP0724-20121128/11712_1 /TAXON_ID=265536 /ORGANISM="Amphiprora sp., Strain CCMP467" /LENGTH=184 /DNA_ID=CAMNT_0008787339 /DNA_START=43 /DNA_END=597 /DNA_ORIENTATION=-